eukprot:sb/3476933/
MRHYIIGLLDYSVLWARRAPHVRPSCSRALRVFPVLNNRKRCNLGIKTKKDMGPRAVTKISFAPYILSIEIKFLAILRLELESIGKMIFFSIQRNQHQVLILSGIRDMSENV